MYKFLRYAFYLLRAGTGAVYLLRLRLLISFGETPAPIFFLQVASAPAQRGQNLRLLPALAPQPWLGAISFNLSG